MGNTPNSLVFCFVLFLSAVESLKFLCYVPNYGRSHVNYQGKIADVLIEAGHEVVTVTPNIDASLPIYKPKKGGRSIVVDPCPEAKHMSDEIQRKDHVGKNFWIAEDPQEALKNFEQLYVIYTHQCNATLRTPGLLEALKAEKFDVAFAEPLDPCGAVIFHKLGITKHVATQSFSTLESYFRFSGAPEVPSYVPGLVSNVGEKMTFMERLKNAMGLLFIRNWQRVNYHQFQQMMRENFPDVPDIHDLYNDVSLMFVNSEPLIEFPRPTTHNIVDIGGIVTSSYKPVNKNLSDILNLRKKTILLSFGTITNSSAMPEAYKNSIRQAFANFPDVTFIWKYEKLEDDVARGAKNIVTLEWIPQNDLLNDPRLTGFITHGGIGSLMETTIAGKPLICVPIFGDQTRNSQVVKRLQTGVVLDKEQLASPDALTNALREILSNPIYAENAKRTANMIAKRPFTMKEQLVRNMEFIAEFGPLDNLRHHGNKLSYIQYYLIDVIAFLATIALTALALILLFLWYTFKCIRITISVKPKKE